MDVYIIMELSSAGVFKGVYGVYKSYNKAKEVLEYLEVVDSDCDIQYRIYRGMTNGGYDNF
jgi:hypothetical protein